MRTAKNPVAVIDSYSYVGQNPFLRMYKNGYEIYMKNMPILNQDDPYLDWKVAQSTAIMEDLAKDLQQSPWIEDMKPLPGEFNRTIIAVEEPTISPDGSLNQGAEFVVAKWGHGFSSPVHGHANGLLHEAILYGKIRVNTYRIIFSVDEIPQRVVRPVETIIVENGTFLSTYLPRTLQQYFKRQGYIHNFTSIGQSATLHYVPEHTRDGRDNSFEVEYFGDNINLLVHTERITRNQCKESQVGDIILVRSTKHTDYGDHYVIMGTGETNGVLNHYCVHAPEQGAKEVLDQFCIEDHAIYLKLDIKARNKFLLFHGISVQEDGKILMPSAK
jgi:hypothetical protein